MCGCTPAGGSSANNAPSIDIGMHRESPRTSLDLTGWFADRPHAGRQPPVSLSPLCPPLPSPRPSVRPSVPASSCSHSKSSSLIGVAIGWSGQPQRMDRKREGKSRQKKVKKKNTHTQKKRDDKQRQKPILSFFFLSPLLRPQHHRIINTSAKGTSALLCRGAANSCVVQLRASA